MPRYERSRSDRIGRTPADAYPGLRPFEAEDAPLFFGREVQVSALLRQLEDHRFVAVVGSSGSGKSSLVRAGLWPAVREGFLLGTTDWQLVLMKPSHQPYQQLARVLNEATHLHGDSPIRLAGQATATPEEAKTLAALRSTDRGLLLARISHQYVDTWAKGIDETSEMKTA